MKFCKNLQRVVDISDPEWAPYWTNYKMLKKLIKELPSLVPTDETKTAATTTANSNSSSNMTGGEITQQHGSGSDESTSSGPTTSVGRATGGHPSNTSTARHSSAAATAMPTRGSAVSSSSTTTNDPAETIGKSPGEVAFFKLLHSEFKKASHFFDRATEEFSIREERVREGMEIMRQPNSIMVNEKWSLMAKSIYRLYKDLLLLETFAIMTYCAFSKILKKHDKVTGYATKNAFMSNIVNRANFTDYPKVLAMISRCEALYEEVSTSLQREGKHGLYEDERLFINMIHRLNEQVLDSEDSQVHGDERKRTSGGSRSPRAETGSKSSDKEISDTSRTDRSSSRQDGESYATSTLRSILEENSKAASPTKVAPSTTAERRMEGTVSEEHCDDDDSEAGNTKVAANDAPKRSISSEGETQQRMVEETQAKRQKLV